MQELIEKLQSEHGLSTQQSHGILNTVTGFLKEKFPMLGSALDSLLPNQGNLASTTPGTAVNPSDQVAGGNVLDRISDFIPGEMGQKAEQFAKDKLGGMFGNKTDV